MERITARDIVGWTSGTLLAGEECVEITSVSTDSRSDCTGALFVPIKGENFDGHDFIGTAVEKGAVAVISEYGNGGNDYPSGVVVVKVNDTLRAFQDIAAGYRRQFTPTIVAVTGSNGKTTTKEFIRAVSEVKFTTVSTKGTKNNHVGLPQSLFSIGSDTEVGVFEIGMSAPGEIRNLARIAGPSIGVITNVYPAHTEFFKSIDDIALAKNELLEVIDEDGVAVLNADDEYFGFLKKRTSSRIRSFGLRNAADVSGSSVRQSADGVVFSVAAGGNEAECRLMAFGEHNASNALAAIAVGLELGIGLEDSCRALSRAELPDMRFQIQEISGIMVINDAYNANPSSTVAALDALEAIDRSGRMIVVLGNMLELGWYSAEGHRKVGKRVASSKADALITVGELAAEIADAALAEGYGGEVSKVDSADEAAEVLGETLMEGDAVFIKGSRAMGLESIVESLKKNRLIESS